MKPRVLTGLDRLPDFDHPALNGRRIGLVTNPTGINAGFESAVDVCSRLPNAKLTALFACEHGIHGQRQAGVLFEDEVEEKLGIPIFSLYGSTKRPTPEMLEHVDTVLFDIQDLGVRFYTYLTTLLYVLEACAKAGKRLLVLDRPNPLGGVTVEGGLLQEGFESMIGAWTMPIRSGMTLGELARMVNELRGLGCRLDVLPMEGWKRSMEYTDTGLPWMMPSPNMPTMDSVRVYAGTCLFEGTNISEGRGTTRPFEWIGAPWLNGVRLADRLNEAKLPGVHFHPVYMTPTFSKHQGELCGGVRLFVTDPAAYESVRTGLTMVHYVMNLHPDHFEWLPPYREGGRNFIDLLTGGQEVRLELKDPGGFQRLLGAWHAQAQEWKKRRQPFLIYGEDHA